MKKLEDIPKKQIFNTPEGYFEKLPSIIQNRVAERSAGIQKNAFFRYKLQYALPFIMIIAFGIYWFSPSQSTDVNTMLAGVKTEQLIAYLDESDITTEDLIEHLGADETLSADEDLVIPDGDLDLDSVQLDNFLDDIDFENI